MSQRRPQTYYHASAGPPPAFARLDGRIEAEFCIIGGGFTGLSAALALAENGARPVLLEAQSIGFGASGRNGGQIHTGLRKDQAALERWLGPGHASDLWRLSEESKALLRGLIARYGIDCALSDGLIIAAHNRRALAHLAGDTAHLAAAYGYDLARMADAEETSALTGTPVYAGARVDRGGGHLHPLALARGLAGAAVAAGASLFEHSAALALEADAAGVTVHTAGGAVRAKRVLVACDAWSAALLPELAPYIAHVESFIIASAPLPDALYDSVLPSNAAVADTRHVLDYYRKSADRRLLFAGRESYWSPPADIAALVRPRMLEVFPQLRGVRVDYAWSGAVGITRTRMPHFGTSGERILFAYGYSGQGVAHAVLGGQLMAEAALGKPERFEVFARVPAAKFPGGSFLRKPMVAAALYAFKLLDAL